MTTPENDDGVLAGAFVMDGNDELITLTEEMFHDPDRTPEDEARLQADLDAMITEDRV